MAVEIFIREPTLDELDNLKAELLVVTLIRGDRPPHGVVGLVDWRMNGFLSDLILRDKLNGDPGEVLLLSPQPFMDVPRVLVVGVGGPGEAADVAMREAERVVEKAIGITSGVIAFAWLTRATAKDMFVPVTNTLIKALDKYGLSSVTCFGRMDEWADVKKATGLSVDFTIK